MFYKRKTHDQNSKPIQVKKLLMENTFDHFLTMEAFVRSGITYSFDGRINKDFYEVKYV